MTRFGRFLEVLGVYVVVLCTLLGTLAASMAVLGADAGVYVWAAIVLAGCAWAVSS